ncbi:MAG TPA: TrmH family RNA methyltransferase [Candidatus Paceibacterota bacterium]
MKSVAQAVVVLPDIRSAHNVGSIFRTCDAAGIDKVYLAGYTPDPLDRFGRPVKEIAKTALGAEKTIPWEHEGDVLKLLAKLKKEGFVVVAIELTENSADYKTIAVAPDAKVAFVFGNEVDGVSAEVLERCDVVAHIPMGGEKESLNVSVAAGIALFRILGI